MAQYRIYNDGEYEIFTDGVDTYRTGARNYAYVIDEELTPGGFTIGIENVDWINIEEVIHALGTGVFREGVRDGKYCIDAALTPMGFDGLESTDGGITGDWLNKDTNDEF
jgi:hypothetical protein